MRRFLRYGSVGAFATLAHYLVLVFAVELLGWAAWVASGAGAVVGAQVAFFGNRRWTFDHRGPIAPAWLRFHGTAVLGALLGMVIVALGVRLGVHYVLAQMVATGAALLLTFAINRSWSFR